MADGAVLHVAAELADLSANGLLPVTQQPMAEALMRQLTQPVRLTVMGPPQSGKSTLVNLLIGATVLEQGHRLPTVEIVWGDTPSCTCTLADGTERHLQAFKAATVAAMAPAFVRIEMPLPALRRISVTELALPGDPEGVRRALSWAAPRTEIALWCTQRFGTAEQMVWSGADESMRDHAFLVVTKADALSTDGTLQQALTQAQTKADQFRHILPVATTQAVAARRPDGTIDRDQLTRSGGRALIAAIMRDIDMSRDAARDRAEVMLLQFGKPVVARAAAAATGATAAKPAPLVLTEPLPMPRKPQAPVIAAPAMGMAEPAAPFVRPVPPQAPPAPARLAGPQLREICEPALARMSRHGREAAAMLRSAGPAGLARLSEETAAVLQWVSDHLDAAPTPACGQLERLRDAAFDAADLVQLMQLESAPGTLGESLSLMLQIKREIEAAVAQPALGNLPSAALGHASAGVPMAHT